MASTEQFRGKLQWGINFTCMKGLELYYNTEETMEGRNAFVEKRKTQFSKFRK